jgi:7-carboxy-7-deazaguanine synthase
MFGDNEITKISPIEEQNERYTVREIFETIQGEGPFAGLPATFIRLGGCNLRCHFCDTDFDLYKCTEIEIEEIVHQALEYSHALVVITGGEPFIQYLEPLVSELLGALRIVQVETAGTLPHRLSPETIKNNNFSIVVSPKTPGLDESIVKIATTYKYLIKAGASGPDGLPMNNTQNSMSGPMHLARPPVGFIPQNIFLQPLDENHIDPEHTKRNQKAAVKMCMRYGYRLSLQQHKILELP